MIRDKNGQMIMVNLLVLAMAVAIMIAIIPMLNSVLNIAKESDNLNCNGYIYNGDENHAKSYNSSMNEDEISCIAIALYIPYLVLAILIGGVSKLLMSGGRDQYGGF